MSRAVMAGLVLAVAVALVLRWPQLDERPMHNDEAVNAVKFGKLWEAGSYQYDPNEHHGPTLLYFTLAWAKLTAAPDFIRIDETQFRTVTVLFGLGLILLLPLVMDGLGRDAVICAATLTAVSPAMVFYSRYYIHEMPLVFFTGLALAAGWRHTRSRKFGWALVAGVAIGLMQATKETFILALAAALGALLLNKLLGRRTEEKAAPSGLRLAPKHAIIGVAAWLVVALLFFSSFFTNASGPLDAVRTYFPWLHRAAGASPHIHPWNFYLARLVYFHSGRGPIWSEGLILGLAVAGGIAAFTRKGLTDANAGFVRFLAFYSLLLAAIYSLIAYKTPWCLLGFWHTTILLAGVGAVALLNWFRQRWMRVGLGALLFAGIAQLASQAWRASVTYCADRRNPYVYAQTSPDILNLVSQVLALDKTNRTGHAMLVKVMAPESDYWPLPWYFRGLPQVGWWSQVPADPSAPVMIVSPALQTGLENSKTHIMVGIFELRPQTFLELYVQTDLWRSYLGSAKLKPQDN